VGVDVAAWVTAVIANEEISNAPTAMAVLPNERKFLGLRVFIARRVEGE